LSHTSHHQLKGKGIRATKGKNSNDLSTQKDSILTNTIGGGNIPGGYDSMMLRSTIKESSKYL